MEWCSDEKKRFALALGAGAKSRVSLGIVVIGGLMFSLVLTLYVIPAMYSYFSKEEKKGKETAEAVFQRVEKEMEMSEV
ncbi:MAG: efflux RND transporter permease subunit [Ignavibacteriales bacterium]|nr:efflux RND transporter permease subunit [Ignavibacteriales bacterium]